LQQLIFQRQGKNIVAKIIGINLEPLDTGNGKQVVFFCEDSGGKRYRVPKSEVIAKGVKPRSKKKARKLA
jgi:hypothetical protein